ncbi:MAG: glycosyltransferase family 4 protein [Actinobacteria bacterium]|nr:glycosyltransferase family 4 protein [Actinomycetota bacterium]
MKILFIAPTPFFSDRGCHTRILGEYLSLVKLGHQIEMVTYHLGKDAEGVKIHRTPNIPWYKKTEAGPSYHKIYIDCLLFFKALIRTVRFKPDIIHGHLHEGALIGSIVGRLTRTPAIADMQGSLYRELIDHNFFKQNGMMSKIWKSVENVILKMPRFIISSSEFTSDYFHKEHSVPLEKIDTINDGTNTSLIRPIKKDKKLFADLGIPQDRKIGIYTGVLTRYQGIDLMLKTLAHLKKMGSKVFFLIVGFPKVEHYQKMADELDIADIVKFTGRISHFEMNRYLSVADFGVTAKLSKTEANIKVLDYMAAGLPVVLFDSKINKDLMGEYGIYCKYNDAMDMALKIDNLLKNQKLIEELGPRVRNHVVSEFSWDKKVEKIENIYKKILNPDVRKIDTPMADAMLFPLYFLSDIFFE